MTKPWSFLGINLPVIQAPMAGSNDSTLVIAVANAGGLGSLPCAMLSVEQIRSEVAKIRAATTKPFNLNFFSHPEPVRDAKKESDWKNLFQPYYQEFGIDPAATSEAPLRKSFNQEICALVEELKPAVVSFHFGLPADHLVKRVKAAGALVLSSATTVAEARWLEAHGCDAIIAQGLEAGGHRGLFLTSELNSQLGTFALLPQIVDAVKIPVIASGGIADARGVKAAFAMGACAVQVGTSYLLCHEAKTHALHRKALLNAQDKDTALTNIFSGRPARGIVNRVMKDLGPMSAKAPDFPLAGTPLLPLRAGVDVANQADFMPLWAGQSVSLAKEISATELTQILGRSI